MKRRGFLKGLLAVLGAPVVANEIVELAPEGPTPIAQVECEPWTYDELTPSVDLATEYATATDTTIAVQNPQLFLAGDYVHVPRTGENLLVQQSSKGLHVVRGIGGPAQDIVDEEPLWIIGNTRRNNA